jgi:hypothetical protein
VRPYISLSIGRAHSCAPALFLADGYPAPTHTKPSPQEPVDLTTALPGASGRLTGLRGPVSASKSDEFVKFESPDSPLTAYKGDEFVKFGPPDSPLLVGLVVEVVVAGIGRQTGAKNRVPTTPRYHKLRGETEHVFRFCSI